MSLAARPQFALPRPSLAGAETDRLIRIGALFVAASLAVVTDFWILFPAVLLLYAIWRYIPTPGEAPVIKLALSYQWAQVFCGLIFYPLAGMPFRPGPDRMPFIILSFGCLTALFLGILVGFWLSARRGPQPPKIPYFFADWQLYLGYFGFVFGSGLIVAIAWEMESITQILLTLNYFKFAFLFLLLRRLIAQRNYSMATLIGALEILVGFTGYFGGFREAFAIILLVLFERFQPRRWQHWSAAAALMAAMVGSGVVWTGIKGRLRQHLDTGGADESILHRFDRVYLAAIDFATDTSEGKGAMETLEKLVDRMWTTNFPAMALERVPTQVPHSEGQFVSNAVMHVLRPRLFFPDKVALVTDSEKVRTYSGVWVAGAESNTSIAFGYAIESYIDFGVPIMFYPVFGFGVLFGLMYKFLVNNLVHRELAIASTVVITWSGLYLFERSWDRMLATTVLLFAVVGVTSLVAERLFQARNRRVY